ncbi:unnamed protein product [Lactuca virosa]|uniref:F-box domain-containing protein n=1 Tax=Lactuca virosa TaxID=75947 RepID=A0AAU9M9E1_9ASTR|nr:unnamed protein product [Lactuca virosa]
MLSSISLRYRSKKSEPLKSHQSSFVLLCGSCYRELLYFPVDLDRSHLLPPYPTPTPAISISNTGMGKKKYIYWNTIRPWSDLTHDVLLLVMMKLGIVEFLVFSRVCKAWRSLAVSNKKKFLGSREPMCVSLTINDPNDKDCNLVGRTIVGVTCGYLILFGEKTSDFWLLNPITSHDLHFPDIPYDLLHCPGNHRGILVYSPSISGYVFVLFNRCYNHKIWFCIAGTREWTFVYTDLYPIHDLIAFKGKIYTAHSVHGSDKVRLCEMKLYPNPKLVLLET